MNPMAREPEGWSSSWSPAIGDGRRPELTPPRSAQGHGSTSSHRLVGVAEGIYRDRGSVAATVKVNSVQRAVGFPAATFGLFAGGG